MTSQEELPFKNPIAGDPLDYILAGNAIVTIYNEDTRKHLIFQVTRATEILHPDRFNEHLWFVAGQVANGHFVYMGIIIPKSLHFTATVGSRMSYGTQHMDSFSWLMRQLINNKLPKSIKIYHNGKCGTCGRRLTVPSSIERGVGPVCIKLIHARRLALGHVLSNIEKDRVS